MKPYVTPEITVEAATTIDILTTSTIDQENVFNLGIDGNDQTFW